jgi:hypothetical protein
VAKAAREGGRESILDAVRKGVALKKTEPTEKKENVEPGGLFGEIRKGVALKKAPPAEPKPVELTEGEKQRKAFEEQVMARRRALEHEPTEDDTDDWDGIKGCISCGAPISPQFLRWGAIYCNAECAIK